MHYVCTEPVTIFSNIIKVEFKLQTTFALLIQISTIKWTLFKLLVRIGMCNVTVICPANMVQCLREKDGKCARLCHTKLLVLLVLLCNNNNNDNMSNRQKNIKIHWGLIIILYIFITILKVAFLSLMKYAQLLCKQLVINILVHGRFYTYLLLKDIYVCQCVYTSRETLLPCYYTQALLFAHVPVMQQYLPVKETQIKNPSPSLFKSKNNPTVRKAIRFVYIPACIC